jgi:ABC-2 type transport system permease protein
MSAVTLDAPTPNAAGDAQRRPGLGRLTRVELRKMVDTRAGFWLQATTALLTVVAVIVVVAAGSASDHEFGQMLAVATAPASVLLPVIGILLVTSEWTQRTTLVTFSLVPQRARVLVAKLLAGVLLALAATAIAIVVAAIGTLTAGSGADGVWSHAAPLIGQTVVSMVTAMIIGIGFGAALLISAPAIVLYFAVPMVFAILGEFSWFRDVAEWTDLTRTTGTMPSELLSGGEWGRALVSLALWMGIPLALGWWRVSKDEVK